MSDMRQRIKSFLKLRPMDRRVWIESWLLRPTTGILLRLFGVQRVLAVARRTVASKPRAPWPIDAVRRLESLVASAEKHGPAKPNCLRRSIVAWWLLRRRGAGVELSIGVRKVEDALEAHAWIELEDRLDPAPADESGSYFRLDRPVLSAPERE